MSASQLHLTEHSSESLILVVFFSPSPNRAEESDEMSYVKELSSVSEPTQIRLGLL